nr:MAG TPA: hypothetical protein [Caudoviricetes sp.]
MVIFRLNVIIPEGKSRCHIPMSYKMILKLRGVQMEQPVRYCFQPIILLDAYSSIKRKT